MSAVFVFGSNLAGRHGAGAALEARLEWGARQGEGVGRFGNSYAIPTKDAQIRTLPISTIRTYVDGFRLHARANPDDSFLVTAIGCGLAGYDARQIAPLFGGMPENVFLSAKLVAGGVG